jgi:hypothetical protein
MSRSALAGIIGLLAITGLGSTPAAAGGTCDCDDHPTGYYVVYAPRAYDYEPRVVAYYADPRMFNRRFHPRWYYAAAYYSSPPRVYGYAHVSRGPAVLLHRYGPRPARWRRRW